VDSLVAAEGSKIGLQLCGIQGKKLGTATKERLIPISSQQYRRILNF
jgi:hypothetical protein